MVPTRSGVLCAVLLLVGAAGQAIAQTPGAKPTSFDDARAQAEQRGTPVLLEFYTEW